MSSGQFKFRKLDSVGAAGAEEDELLFQCFVDSGWLEHLEDLTDRRRIVVGRTGAGKTALLMKLAEKHPASVIQIAPDQLALTYVSNSTVLAFFASLGVNLDPFFKLLWRHVIVVEILARHIKGLAAQRPQTLLGWLRSLFTSDSRDDREMRAAIDYLERWGKDFWLETEFRVKEITETLESELAAELKAGFQVSAGPAAEAGLQALLADKSRLSAETRAELQQRGQRIVSQTQVRDLQKVMTLLDRVLDRERHEYYVLIDRLDENWVEERLRYRLIMALLDTIKEFSQISRAKIIVALRRDLVERVFRLARDSGFQEEKYRSLFLPVIWTSPELVELLDRRIDALVKKRYTKQTVAHRDLLPRQIRKTPITDYITARVTRPRDMIAFFNQCIIAGEGEPRLDSNKLALAEGEYSRGRLRALGDEWSADFPGLLDFARVLKNLPSAFRVRDIGLEDIEQTCLEIAAENPGAQGLLHDAARKVVDLVMGSAEFRLLLIGSFYTTGIVGLKLETFEATSWVDERGRSVAAADISEGTRVCVHPAYHRALGIA